MMEIRVRRARQAAARVLHRCGVEQAQHIDVEAIACALGADVVSGNLDGALARLVRVGDRSLIRLAENNTHPGKRRLSVANELGHLALDHAAPLDPCRVIDLHERDGDIAREAEANAFASELLLPERLVRRRCEVSPVHLGIVEAIARDFGTSMAATAIRFAELTSERCAAVLSQRGRVRWCARSATFWPEIARGQALDPWSLAHDFFAKGCVHHHCEPVRASAWITDDSAAAHMDDIFEHAFVIPDLEAVLSLLWIPEALAGDVA